jgi:hypothetical protein
VAITLPLQLLDLHPEVLDLPRHLAGVERPQQGGGQVAERVGHLRVDLPAPRLVDRLAEQGHDVGRRAEGGVGLGRWQDGGRLAAPAPALRAGGLALRRAVGVVVEAERPAMPRGGLAAGAIGLPVLALPAQAAHASPS